MASISKTTVKSGLGGMKRNWEDSKASSVNENYPSIPSPQQSPVRKRPTLSPEEAVAARERRMRAIEAAMSGGPSSSGAPASSMATSSTQATVGSSSRASTSTAADPFNDSDSESLQLKRRQLPWEANHSSLKAAQKSNADFNDAPTGSRPRAGAASDIGMDIRSKICLSKEQKHVLMQVLDGKNVFFTGSAGTGKSVLLREIIRSLRTKYSKSQDAVAVTASTGIAACNIGGVTLHNFSGAGLCIEPVDQLANKIKKNKKSITRWLRTKALVLDEISMVEADLFDKLSSVAMVLRKNTKPFGGIQVIVCGDFFQLPPVVKNAAPKFAFEADSWNQVIQFTFNLTQVFRQKDQEFVDMLNEMRFGKLSDKSVRRFKALSREIVYDDMIEPTELFPRREEVDRSNKSRMSQLEGARTRFVAHDGGTLLDPKQREKVLGNFMAQAELELCVNSQVMLIKNVDATLVNGSMGRVVGFCDPALYRGLDNKGEIIRMDDTYDTNTKAGSAALDRKQKMAQEGKKYEECPVVKFQIPGGGLPRVELIQRESFKVELPNGEIQVSRHQFPLILAWAMSIHKSQGQTLDRVKVDLGRVFEKGQAYVALSRATSLQGLQVLGFDRAKVQAHPKVAEWSKTLPTVADIMDIDETTDD